MIGELREIGRFPVKSMLGESPEQATVVATGIAGDRTHALVGASTGKVAAPSTPACGAAAGLSGRSCRAGRARSRSRCRTAAGSAATTPTPTTA